MADSSRHRPDPLITPHKPGVKRPLAAEMGSAPHGKNSPGKARPRIPRARRRIRLRFRWRLGWRARLVLLAVVAVTIILAFRLPGAQDRATLPSVRKNSPVELPPPQSFPDQDTVRTKPLR